MRPLKEFYEGLYFFFTLMIQFVNPIFIRKDAFMLHRKFLVLVVIALVVMCSQAWGAVEITSENFPDNNFRSYVSSTFDTDSDGVLSDEELARVTRIPADLVYGTSTSTMQVVEGISLHYITNYSLNYSGYLFN